MRTLAATALLLGLAACSRAPADPTVVVSPATMVEAGEWTMTATTIAASRPGFPAIQSADQLQPKVSRMCLSAADAATIDPAQLASGTAMEGCRREAWSVKDGAISAQLVCPSHAEDIREVPTTIHGAFTHKSIWVQVDQTALGLTFSKMLKAERTGTC